MNEKKTKSLADPIIETVNTLRNLVANLGTRKDKRSYSYFTNRVFTYQELEDMYTNDWLSGKIIDIPANDAVRNWRRITTPSLDPEELEKYLQAEKDFDVKVKFNDALRWSYLFGGSLIFLGVENSGNLEEPLVLDGIKEGDLEHIHVMDRWMVSASEINSTDPTKSNYQFPEYYMLPGGHRVHHTRVIRFDGFRPPFRVRQRNNYWGSPMLQRVYDAVLNSQSFAQIVNSLVYEAKLDVVSVPGLMQKLSTPDGEKQLVNRFMLADMLKSINNMLLLDAEENHDRKQTSFGGLDSLIDKYLTIVSAASDIPATRLLGQSPGGLNSTGESDLENYYNMIGSKQETELDPALNYFDQVFTRSTLGYYPDDWSFEFNSLWQLSDKTKSEIQKSNADRDKVYIETGVIVPSIAAKQLKEDKVYTSIDDEYVEALEAVEGFEDDTADLNNADFTNPSIGRAPSAKDKGKMIAQSVILAKKEFNKTQAEQWIKEHKEFGNYGVDETSTSYRFRQYDPQHFIRGSFRNDAIADGVTIVLGKVK